MKKPHREIPVDHFCVEGIARRCTMTLTSGGPCGRIPLLLVRPRFARPGQSFFGKDCCYTPFQLETVFFDIELHLLQYVYTIPYTDAYPALLQNYLFRYRVT